MFQITPVIKNIIIINVLFFIGQIMLPQLTFAISGAPDESSDTNVKALIESLLDHAKANSGWLSNDVQEKLARKLAHLGAVGRTKKMTAEEMEALVGQLFQCQQVQSTPDGKPTMIKHGLRDLQKQFLH